MTPHPFVKHFVLLCWVGGSALGLHLPALALESAAPPLDVLFYTPAQRADIMRERQPQGSGTSLFGTVQRLSGVVRRGNGKSTVWVNGKPLAEGAPKAPALQGMDAVVEGKRLRVGESIDPLSGTRGDVVAPGAVTVQPHP